eukprot:TRINITY_DN3715_c0_g1_i3.p1 TRINITY_DN3715_c0_g1~~TRINITY_DN3715_c0_g1_i3.p1  ORF type:complete len:1423 (+),score=212.90 TRINITY_DN3715_c0_g1_i3:126-4394(+)
MESTMSGYTHPSAFRSSQFFSVAWAAKNDHSSMLSLLAAYVPNFLIHRMLQSEPIKVPDSEKKSGVVMSLRLDDIEQITSDLHAKSGKDAGQAQEKLPQEKLVAIINSLYADVIDVVLRNGGDIFSLDGHDITAVWIYDISGKSFPVMIERACFCAMKVREVLSDAKFKMPVSISIAVGELVVQYLGGLRDKRAFMLAGKAWLQSCLAMTRGKTVLTSEARDIVASNCVTTTLRKDVFELESIKPAANFSETIQFDILMKVGEDDRPRIEANLRMFLSSPVLFRLDAKQTGWGAEHRILTIVCVRIADVKNSGIGSVKAQVAYSALQSITSIYEGTIAAKQMNENDSLFTLVFGLPPMSHSNDIERGVQAAHTLFERLSSLTMTSTIGLSSGGTFCGSLGNQARREYSIIGKHYRTAIGFSTFPEPGIYCDESTKIGARGKFLFSVVEGHADAFRVTGSRPLEQTDHTRTAMIGRKLEWGKLWRTLQDYIDKGTSRIVIIRGDSGMGKTRMIEEVIQIMTTASPNLVLQGSGDPLNTMTPYYAYRKVAHKLLGLDENEDTATKRQAFVNFFRDLDIQKAEEFLPLINAVISLDLPDNAVTSKMSGQVRLENVKSLMVTLFKVCARDSPKLLIIDDAHQMDSLSWSLTCKLRDHVVPFYIVLVLPSNANPPHEFSQLVSSESAVILNLKDVSTRDISSIVCSRLKIADRKLPDKVEKMISEKSQGNPALAIELGLSLVAANVIQVKDGTCVQLKSSEEILKFTLPDGIKAYIVSRIDSFPASVQLTLKAASVCGQSFSFDLIKDIYPTTITAENLKGDLLQLQQLGVLGPQTFPEYAFKNIIYQEAAYSMMILAQKKLLHKNVAEWYERKYVQDLAPHYALLAHHWELAEGIKKAVKYLDVAADSAAKNNANDEVIQFLTKAGDLDKSVNRIAKARRYAHLGEAMYNLGRLEESESILMSSLNCLEAQLPQRPYLVKYYVNTYSLRQQIYTCLPLEPVAPNEKPSAELLVKALLLLSKIHIYRRDSFRSLFLCMQSLDLAKRLGNLDYIIQSSSAILLGCCSENKFHGRLQIFEELSGLLSDVPPDLNTFTQAQALQNMSSYQVCIGSFKTAQENLEKAAFLYSNLSARRQIQECVHILAFVHYMKGNLSLSSKVAKDLYDDAEQHLENQACCWGLLGQSRYLLATGNHLQAAERLSQAEKLLPVSDIESLVDLVSQQGICLLRQGKSVEAQEKAFRATQILTETHSHSFMSINSMSCIAEVLLTVWNSLSGESTLSLQQRRRATDIVAILSNAANTYEFARPRALYYKGVLLAKGKDSRGAIRCFREGLACAQTHQMIGDEAMILCQMGQLECMQDERSTLITRAITLFEEAGLSYQLEEALRMQAVTDIQAKTPSEKYTSRNSSAPTVSGHCEPPTKQLGW